MSSTAALHTGEVRAGRFDPEVFVNCLHKAVVSCKQLTKTSGSKRPALTSPCVKLQYCSLNLRLIQETQL